MGDIRSRLASISLSTSLLVVVGLAGGCGDNTPRQTGTGGSSTGGSAGGHAGGGGVAGGGGAAGSGGLAGADAGPGGQGGLGGVTDGGAPDAPVSCYNTTFTTPAANNATLTVLDDNDHTCADGFQYTVKISSDAPDGTEVTLYDGNTVLKTVAVSGHAASFDVQLSTGGTAQALSIQYPSTTTCSVVRMVTIMCPDNPPTCSISKPVISATHPDLNGVQAPGGDRTSSAGSMYQATFTVQTSAEESQPVTLAVDNAAMAAAVTTLNGTVSNGSATFPVTLVPDGTYEVVATCTNKNGVSASSAKATFVVDTAPPNLTVTKPSAGMFVVGGTVDVCGQTSDGDAAALASSLGAGQSNFCVTVGSAAAPSCVPMVALNSPSCVTIPCPGAAPFNLTISLKDAAGNPTTQTLTGITCASSHPTVQIVAPASDSPTFKDVTKHILAANAPMGVKDQDAATSGAQADVVACTDMPGIAVLTAGHVSDTTLNQLGPSVTTVAATAGDNCPSNLPNVARFAGVTLPESTENADGTLASATRLVVSVTSTANSANTGISLPDDVWVDSMPPNLAFVSPAGLCGSFIQSSTTVNEDLVYTADYASVVVDVTNGSTTTTYDTPAFMNGSAAVTVALTDGANDIVATETDPAGNATVLPDCQITLGMAPVVKFTTPTSGAILCPAGATANACVDDNDTGTAGWQGSLAVTVTAAGVPVTTGAVTFTIGGNSLGSANLDGSGNAQLNGITIPEGVQTIVATTSSIPNAGVGSGSVTVTVDTTPPNAPTGLSVLVKDRRATSMQLTWTAPTDSTGGNVAGYQVRYAKVPIDSTNFDNPAVTTAVVYTGAPASPGQLDGIAVSGLYIENGYYFAVKAVDVAGSTSPILATPSGGTCTCNTNCCAAHFNSSVIASPAGTNQSFGVTLDGSRDVNGDGKSDLVVGTSGDNHAYLFLGASTFGPSAPDVTFTGTNVGFGATVREIGDIDGDGLSDLAIADRPTGLRVLIYKGRTTWPATLSDAQADYVITTGAAYAGSQFGVAIDALGDFDGDGVDDFVISAPLYSARVGRVLVVYGKSGFTSFSAPDSTRSLEIAGDPTLARTQFGTATVGLGHFYTATAGTTLIVSAPGLVVQPSDNAGRIYAFHGRAAGAAIDATSADAVFVGPGTGSLIGNQLSNLGPILGGVNNLGSSNLSDNMSVPGNTGTGFLLSGSTASGPFASKMVLYQSGTNLSGQVFFGGGFSGLDGYVSMIGGSSPDVVFAGQLNKFIDIIDGSKVGALTSPVNTVVSADVHVPMPAGWSASANSTRGLVRDINGDSYPDFAIGDLFGTVPGRVVVFW